MTDPIHFGLEHHNPAYLQPKGYTTAFVSDEATFCIRIFNACKKEGHIPPTTSRDHFVRQCRKGMPEILLTEADIVSSAKSIWDFRNSAGNFRSFYPHASNNFSIYHPTNAAHNVVTMDGEALMQKAASSQATPERCRDFSDGGPGATPQTVTGGAKIPVGALLAPALREALSDGAVDLPWDGYPQTPVIPSLYPGHTSFAPSWAKISDAIALGTSFVAGSILLLMTRGSLPPLEAPATPSLFPCINSSDKHSLAI